MTPTPGGTSRHEQGESMTTPSLEEVHLKLEMLNELFANLVAECEPHTVAAYNARAGRVLERRKVEGLAPWLTDTPGADR